MLANTEAQASNTNLPPGQDEQVCSWREEVMGHGKYSSSQGNSGDIPEFHLGCNL